MQTEKSLEQTARKKLTRYGMNAASPKNLHFWSHFKMPSSSIVPFERFKPIVNPFTITHSIMNENMLGHSGSHIPTLCYCEQHQQFNLQTSSFTPILHSFGNSAIILCTLRILSSKIESNASNVPISSIQT